MGKVFQGCQEGSKRGQIARLGNIFEFLYNQDIWPQGLNTIGPAKVTSDRMKQILSNEAFKKWLGSALLVEMTKFSDLRDVLLKTKDSLKASNFFSAEPVKTYFETRNKIISEFQKRGVELSDNGVECD